MSRHLSNSERLRIMEEYLSSSISKYAIQTKYVLSTGSILSRLRKFGLSDKAQSPDRMRPKCKEDSRLSMSEQEELVQLRKENRALKVKLKREELGHKAYKMLVDLAEETYGIEIRKNSAAK